MSDVLQDLKRAAERKWHGDPACQQAGLFARAVAEIERLRADLGRCGKSDCMGYRIDGARNWVTTEARDAAVAAERAKHMTETQIAEFGALCVMNRRLKLTARELLREYKAERGLGA